MLPNKKVGAHWKQELLAWIVCQERPAPNVDTSAHHRERKTDFSLSSRSFPIATGTILSIYLTGYINNILYIYIQPDGLLCYGVSLVEKGGRERPQLLLQ